MNKIKYAALFSLFIFAGLHCWEPMDVVSGHSEGKKEGREDTSKFRYGKGLICKEFLSYLTQLKELIYMQIPCEYAPQSLDDVLKDILENKKLDDDWELKRALIATAVKAGASANTQMEYTNPLFKAAASKCDYYLTEFLLKHSADPNIRQDYGLTPLSLCVLSNKYDLTELLLKYGANPNHRAYYGVPLFDADTIKMAELLLSYGAIPAALPQYRGGRSLLHEAMCDSQEPGLVALWLEKGLDLNDVDNRNRTPLHDLIFWYRDDYKNKGDFETKVRLLLKAGARLDIRSEFGDTPIERARKNLSAKRYNRFLQIIKEVEQEREKEKRRLMLKDIAIITTDCYEQD